MKRDWKRGPRTPARWRNVARAMSAAALVVGLSQAAAAQSSPADKAAADALFDSAVELMGQGNFDEACPKLQKSHDLDPGVGTLLNLGRCYKEGGRTASAWSAYREAAALARKERQTEREKLARDEVKALESRLVRLKIEVSAEISALPGLRVTQNGDNVSTALLGEAIPVDPGPQKIVVTADGGREGTFSADATKEGETYSVQVGELSEDSAPVAAEPVDGPAEPAEEPARVAEEQPTQQTHSHKRSPGPIILGVAGLAGLGVGTAFGVMAKTHDNNARSICEDVTLGCTEDDVADWNSELQSANNKATVAYIGFVVGGAAVAGAVVWWLVDSPPKQESTRTFQLDPVITGDTWGLSAQGSF